MIAMHEAETEAEGQRLNTGADKEILTPRTGWALATRSVKKSP